jgi:hypothetical protein
VSGGPIEILFPVNDKGRSFDRSEFDHAVTVRGREYQVKHVRQCDTCTSPHRNQIERAVMRGGTYAGAVGSVSEARPSSRSVRQHFRLGHWPWLHRTRERVMSTTLAPILGLR